MTEIVRRVGETAFEERRLGGQGLRCSATYRAAGERAAVRTGFGPILIVWRCDRGSDTGPLPNRFSDIFILLSFLSQEPAASLQAGPVSVTLYPSDMSDSDIFDIFVSTEQRCGRGPGFRPTGAFGFSSNNFAIFANCLKPARETQ